MADTAFMKQFRRETIAAFEQTESLVRQTTTTEVVVSGNQAEIQVAGSGGGEATTRGLNGDIPFDVGERNQITITLSEWHAPEQRTRFNIFSSQGNEREIMQRSCMAKLNRKIDSQIITELNTATINTGAAVPASMELCSRAKAMLGNNDVPFDGNIYALITPAFESLLYQVSEFSNHELVQRQPIPGADLAWNDRPNMYSWFGIKWIVHPNLPGKGTNAEKCFLYHKSAIVHAMDAEQMNIATDYESKHDRSWVRCSGFFGSEIVQNSGIIVINHDGSSMSA